MIDQNLLQNTSNLADIQNSYVTGGPGPRYVDNVLDKYMTPKPASQNPVFNVANTQLSQTPSGVRFPYYYPTLGVEGNEELYAQGQSWYEKAFNATTKGLGIAASTLIQGTAGLLLGTTNAIIDGKFSSFYDNDFSRSLDDWNKQMEDQFPNYYTQAEQDANWYSPTNLLTANFLFDKVVKNLGYAVGAIGAGYGNAAALRALGLFSKVASAGGLAEAASMSEEAIAAVQAGQRMGAIEGGMKSLAQKFLSGYNTLNKAQRVITAGLGTMGEASFEALQSANEFRTKLIQDYITKNGQEPDREALAEIENMADNVGNTTFGLNVALLSATNYLQWNKILGSSYSAERRLFADTAEEIGEVVEQGGRYASKFSTLSKAGKALYKARNISSLFFSPTEAFEEGAQTAIQYGTRNYFDKAYNNKDADVLTDLLGEGARYTLTSKEGIESILIGGLSGGIMEARSKLRERGLTGTGGRMGAATASAVDAFNQTLFSKYMRDTTDSVNRSTVIQQQRAEAIRRGDFQEARDLEYDYSHSYLASRIKYGRFDLVMSDIADQKQLASSPEGFRQLQEDGIAHQDETADQYRARLANIESHARNVALMYRSLNTRYGAILDENGRKKYTSEVIDKMVYAASKIADYDERIVPLSSALMAQGINVQPIVDSLRNQDLPSTEATRDALNQINNLDVTSDVKDTLKDQLRDTIEIGLRRKAFIREFDRIKNNPASFQDEELVPSDASTVPIPQESEDGRYRNRNFDIGQTYNVSDPFLREDNNLTVLPNVTLHERNALGEIRATLPTRETTFIQPSDLRGYTLQDNTPFDREIAEKKFQESLTSVLQRRGVEQPTGTLQEQLDALNTPENTELIDAIEEAFKRDLADLQKLQEEVEELRRNEAKLKAIQDLFNQLMAEAGTVPTGDPELDRTLIQTSFAEEGAKKTKEKLFISTTSPDTSRGESENNNFHRRANKFLNNLGRGEVENPEQIKVILVTATNQDALGLPGFIQGGTTREVSIDNLQAEKERELRAVFSSEYEEANISFDKFTRFNLQGARRRGDEPITGYEVENNLRSEIAKEQGAAGRFAGDAAFARKLITLYEAALEKVQKINEKYEKNPPTTKTVTDNNIDEATIRAVFIRQTSTGSSFINEEGQNIAALGSTPDLNSLVYSTMPNTSINWRNGDPRYITIGPKAMTQKEAETLATAWRTKREQILKETGYTPYSFNVSRGIPNAPDRNVRNPVTDSLVDKDQLDSLIIQIPTQSVEPSSPLGNITAGEDTYAYPLGRPVLSIGSTITYLDNRKLTDKEKDTVRKAIVELSRNVENKAVVDFLKGILYWGRPKGTPSSNQVWYDNGRLFLGSEDAWTPFTPDNLLSSPELTRFLNNAYFNANNFLLKQNTGYNEILDIADDGTLTQVQWRSYQHYLLSPTYETTKYDNSGLSGQTREAIPLTTSISIDSTDPYDAPFNQKYATLVGLDIAPQQARPAPAAQPAQQPNPAPLPAQTDTEGEEFAPITQAGEFVLDGTTLNPISFKDKNLLDVAATISTDGVQIQNIEWKLPEGAPQQLKDILTEHAIAEISKAALAEMQRRKGNVTPSPQTAPEVTVAPPSNDPIVRDEEGNPIFPESRSEQIERGRIEPDSTKPSDRFKNLRPPSAGSDFRMTIPGPYVIENIPSFTAWMKSNLPQIPVHTVQNLIEMTGNAYAWGVFQDNAIYIYENAEVGTGYHEAFEAVYNAFLTDNEQKALIAEFNRRAGSFTDRETGKDTLYSEATPHQAKEQLAEEFREYKLNGTLYTPRATSFFQRLINFIRELIFGGKVKDLFNKLNTGFFADKPVIQRNVAAQPRIAGFNQKFFRDVMEGMTVKLFQELFKNNKNIVSFDETNPLAKEIYDNLYNQLDTIFTNDIPYALQQSLAQDNITGDAAEAYWAEMVKFQDEVWGSIKNNWASFVVAHKDFLKPFSIIFRSEEDINEVSSNENPTNDDNKNMVEYDRDILKIDAKKSASTAVKLLFATLTDVDPLQNPVSTEGTLLTPEEKLSSLKLPVTVKYAKVFNKFLHEVSNTNGMDNIIKKIKDLAQKDQRFIRLYKRIRAGNNYDNLSIDDWKLLMKLYTTASKQKPDYLIQVTDDAGNTYIANSNDNTQTKILMRQWLNNLKGAARRGNLVFVDDGQYKVNTDEIRSYKINQRPEQLRFVSDIGFTFSQQMYDALSPINKSKFIKAVTGLHAQLSKSGEIGAITNRALGIAGSMNALAEIAVTSTGDDSNAQHFNIEGEPVQNFILQNYVSYITNDINSYPTRDALLEALPHYRDIFSQDSLLLELDGPLYDKNGNRKDGSLQVTIVEGSTQTTNTGSKGTATANLSIAARRLQEFNQNLNGVYYVLIPADSKTEWSLRTGHYIDYSDFNNKGALTNKVNTIFRNYLRTEILMAQDAANRTQVNNLSKTASKLRFFKDILQADMVAAAQKVIDDKSDPNTFLEENRATIQSQISEWLKARVDAQIDNFLEYRIVTSSLVNNEERFSFRGLDTDFVNNADIPRNLTAEQLRDIVRFRTLNYVINGIEMHKVFFGDPAQVKDATKRIKSFLSGRETTYHTDPYFNTFANTQLNKAGDIALQPGDPGYHIFKDYMNTVTVSDIEVVGSIASNESLTADQIDPDAQSRIYGNTNEADAQSWATLPAYREMLLKAGGRWTDAQEAQFQYDAAYERQARSNRNDRWKYTYTNEALQAHDEQLVAQGSPEADLYVLKPIGSGVKYNSTFADMFLDKTSTLPMSYRLAEGRQMEDIYLQMTAQDKQYLIAISGRKIGAQGIHSMYNPDGSINQDPFNNNVQVPFKYWGIQVETGGHKDKQTRGSQLTKLSIIDLISAGVPIDTNFDLDVWLDMDEAERLKASNVYKLVQKNRQILDGMTNRGYQNILSKLGIVETDQGFHIPDYQKVVDYIRKEIDRRELPDNIREAVSVNPETGELMIPLEALNNYKILKNIIYSIVDKNMLSPKVSGGPKVQVSSTLFERNKRKAVYRDGDKWVEVKDYEALTDAQKKTVRLTSSELKFYTPEQPWIEILVPHWFKDKLTSYYKQRGLPIPSDEELLKYLKDNNSPLLKAIGFRIPTQALSSIENIRIKGFLPQEYGSAIVVPSEITSKAGSDFDIDKLNLYLRNFRINSKGFPEHITLTGQNIDTSSEQGRRELYDKFFGSSVALLNTIDQEVDDLLYREDEEDTSVNSLINNIFAKYLDEGNIPALLEMGEKDEAAYKKALERYIPFSKFQEMIEGKTLYDIYGMFDPKALENEYYETLDQLLSLPQNFKRLIQPNSAKELEDLRDELLEAQGLPKSDVKGNYSVLLDPMFMSMVRHNFISGKGGVGIAAVQQTNNPLSQNAVLVVNHRNFRSRLNPLEQGMVPNTDVMLPHNSVSIRGERFVTLSKVLNTMGEYISDKISSYINGYVDVAKDAFIIELGADLNVASTYMFLEKIGVPTRDVIFFMNQPIIKELLKEMQIKNLKYPNTWTVQRKLADTVRSLFPAKEPRTGPFDTSRFKSNIEKYREQRQGRYTFTQQENAEQQQVLDEFFKYYVMASHLFKVTQGSNYDTANFNEPALIYRKQKATENARFNSIISSVDKILNSSFIGNVADKLIKVKGALGTIFKVDTPTVASIIEDVMDPYLSPDKFLSEKDFLGITTRIQSSFIDWITQTLGEGRINAKLKPLLIDNATSVANQLFDLKKSLPQDSDILANPILQQLQATFDNSFSNEVKIVTLVEKALDSPTANMYTDSFRELRDNPHTRPLYDDLIYAAIIQSGIRKSPISFTDLIPVEDYSPILTKVMQNLEATPDLQNFSELHAFERNNWSDDQIVPPFKPKEIATNSFDPEDVYIPAYHVPAQLYDLPNNPGTRFVRLHSMYDNRLLGYNVIKIAHVRINPATDEEYTKSEQQAMRKRGDFSFQSYSLYTPVLVTRADGSKVPYTSPDPRIPGQYFILFKQINAWGSPGKVQEYYNDARPSVLPSNAKIEEYTDSQILNALATPLSTDKLVAAQTDEDKYQEDYIPFEEVDGTTDTEKATGTTTEEDIRQEAAEAPFEMTEEDIQKVIQQLKNSGDATTTDC